MAAHVHPGIVWLAIALVALSVACGGDDDAASARPRLDAEDWVAAVCAKARDYDAAQSDAIRPLAEADEKDPEQLKEAIESMARNSQFAAEEFLGAVERIGAPDIPHADEVMDAFRDNEKEQKDVLDKFRSDVNELDTQDKRYVEYVLDLVGAVETQDFRARLEALDAADVDDLVDLIDIDVECSFILFTR